MTQITQKKSAKSAKSARKKNKTMAKLKNINNHFVESDYENALIYFLEREGWQYLLATQCQGITEKKFSIWTTSYSF